MSRQSGADSTEGSGAMLGRESRSPSHEEEDEKSGESVARATRYLPFHASFPTFFILNRLQWSCGRRNALYFRSNQLAGRTVVRRQLSQSARCGNANSPPSTLQWPGALSLSNLVC